MTEQIDRIWKIIELFRKQLNKDLPSQHIALLLAVARQPGITMPELCKELDMPQGTVSRNVKLMSHYCDKNEISTTKKGYGLLETDQASDNRYQLAVFLTAAGQELIEELTRIIGNENATECQYCRKEEEEISIKQRLVS